MFYIAESDSVFVVYHVKRVFSVHCKYLLCVLGFNCFVQFCSMLPVIQGLGLTTYLGCFFPYQVLVFDRIISPIFSRFPTFSDLYTATMFYINESGSLFSIVLFVPFFKI